jgi:hypothetical protein
MGANNTEKCQCIGCHGNYCFFFAKLDGIFKKYPVLFANHNKDGGEQRKEKVTLSWLCCLYDLTGDDIILKREWLKTNILDFFDHLSIKKYVTDKRNEEIKRMNNKTK